LDKVQLKGKRILVAPLDWGLGHATRCMPIIDLLLRQGATVVIGGEGRSLFLLKSAYPQLTSIDLPAYNIRYSQSGKMVLKTLAQTPRLLRVFREEHRLLDSLIDEMQIDAVLSDNRYGLWTTKVPCVFMCHQLALMMPKGFSWIRRSVYKAHLKYIDRFSYLWIPDLPGSVNLSGSMSHQYALPSNARFIGPQSRFTGMTEEIKNEPGQILVVLSGPEPQRSILEKLIITQCHDLPYTFTIVRGITEEQRTEKSGNITLLNFLGKSELLKEIQRSAVVISRPGYSTVMDLSILQKRALFIPTPGQTEQAYLAMELKSKGYTALQSQYSLDLNIGIQEAKSLPGIPGVSFEDNYLLEAILEWMNSPRMA